MTITPDALTTLPIVKEYLRLVGTAQDTNLASLITAASAAIAKWCRRDFFLASNGVNPLTEYLSGYDQQRLLLSQRPVVAPIRTGNVVQGSAVITGLTSVAYLFVNQCVSSSAFSPVAPQTPEPQGAYIVSLDGPAQITLNVPALVTQTGASLIFGLGVWVDDAAYYGTAPGAFAAGTQLFEGSDFALRRDIPGGGGSSAGWLERINGGWDGRLGVNRWALSAHEIGGQGNVKVKYISGLDALPEDLQMGATKFVALLRESGVWTGIPPGEQGMTARATSMLETGQEIALDSIRVLLSPHRRLIIGGRP